MLLNLLQTYQLFTSTSHAPGLPNQATLGATR